jgi:hypothetical protein
MIVVNASGAGAVVWEGPGLAVHFAALSGADGSVRFTRTLSAVPVGNGTLPNVTIDAFGNAVVVWQMPLGGRGVVQARRVLVGGGVRPVSQLSQPGVVQDFPVIAGAPDGRATAVWQFAAARNSGTTVQVAQFVP